MIVPWRLFALVGLGLLLSASPGCKKKEEKKKPKGAEAPLTTAPSVAPPRSVMVYMGLKNPAQTIDDALQLVGQFAPVPFNRSGLLDLFAQRAKLPREMIDTIDIGRPMWLVGLDDAQVEGDQDPLVLLLPLRSSKAFEKALAKKLKKAGTDGKLTVYKPKPGAVGAHEAKLRIEKTHVVAASSAKAYGLVEAFVGGLTQRTPAHDLTLHMMVEHILKVRGEDLDRRVDQAMDQMRQNLGRKQGPIDQQKVAGATEKTVRRWIETLKSTHEVRFTVDVNKELLTASLRGSAQPKGRLAALIKRQKPGEPFGYKLLPASSWLAISDHGNPKAKAENRKTWEPLLAEMLKGMAPEKQAPLLTAVTEATEIFTGDYTVAFHRSPAGEPGSGLTCSMVGKVTDQHKALAASDKLVSALGGWIKAVVARSKEKVPKGFKFQRKPFAHGKAKGTLFELHLALPPEKLAELRRVLGEPVALGVAFSGSHGLITLGKEAEKQLKTLAEGAESGKVKGALSDNPAFERARTSGTERVGLLYISLVDLVRWVEGIAFKKPIAAALKKQKVTAAPSLDWGVNKQRSELDFTLRLPAAHFRTLMPVLKELQQRGGLPGLLGGRKPASWEDF